MTKQPWQSALTRWGDVAFRLALLQTNNRAQAEQATLRACVAAFTTTEYSADPEAAAYAALVHQRPPRVRFPQIRRPRPVSELLAGTAPADRGLLGVWLLRDITGARLVSIARQPAAALVARIAAVLVPLLPADDPVHTDDTARQAFTDWLAHSLELDDHALSRPTIRPRAAWAARIEEIRAELHRALGKQHLPPGVHTAIDAAIEECRSAPNAAWWQQRPVWIGGVLALAALLLLLVIAPWRSGAQANRSISSAQPGSAAPMQAQDIVQAALDGWATQPISGTLHQRVWSVDPSTEPRVGRPDQYRTPAAQIPQITDVWRSADDPRYRIEVRRDKELIEWQVGDGKGQLSVAVDPEYSACPWGDVGTVNRAARTLPATPAEQRAVLQARLQQGAYGIGYQALAAARTASDLHSFGTRIDGDQRVLVLGFTDRRVSGDRQLLLLFDVATRRLRVVQELSGDGSQTKARDLWRLELHEITKLDVPLIKPPGEQAPQTGTRLLDPTCPELHAEHLLSLRNLAIFGDTWWGNQQFLPTTRPPGTERAMLLNSQLTEDGIATPQGIRAIFIGPAHWLRLTNSGQNSLPTNSAERGPWRVQLNETRSGWRGTICYFRDTANGCAPSLELAAQGWTRDELLAIIDTLTPVTAGNWTAFDDLFFDPAPLQPEVARTLEQAFAATQPPRDGLLFAEIERFTRIEPQRQEWPDPYHVPLAELQPERIRERAWITTQGGQVGLYKYERRLPDDSLLSALVRQDDRWLTYDRTNGLAYTLPNDLNYFWMPGPPTFAMDLLTPFLSTTNPITLTNQPDGVLLEQAANEAFSLQMYQATPPPMPWLGDLDSRFIRRVRLDPQTGLPRRMQIVDVAGNGQETLVSSVDLTAWRAETTPPTAELFQLADLPSDTLSLIESPNSDMKLNMAPESLRMPSRTLQWADPATAQILDDQPATASGDPVADQRIVSAISSSIWEVRQSGVTRTTRYQLPGIDNQIQVQQGSRALLRHILRYNWREQLGPTNSWAASTPVEVTIAGQPTTAWLLESRAMPMLVVEVDDLLLQLSGASRDVLLNNVAPALATLTWSA